MDGFREPTNQNRSCSLLMTWHLRYALVSLLCEISLLVMNSPLRLIRPGLYDQERKPKFTAFGLQSLPYTPIRRRCAAERPPPSALLLDDDSDASDASATTSLGGLAHGQCMSSESTRRQLVSLLLSVLGTLRTLRRAFSQRASLARWLSHARPLLASVRPLVASPPRSRELAGLMDALGGAAGRRVGRLSREERKLQMEMRRFAEMEEGGGGVGDDAAAAGSVVVGTGAAADDAAVPVVGRGRGRRGGKRGGRGSRGRRGRGRGRRGSSEASPSDSARSRTPSKRPAET